VIDAVDICRVPVSGGLPADSNRRRWYALTGAPIQGNDGKANDGPQDDADRVLSRLEHYVFRPGLARKA
jgi:hypothetical protein